MSLSTTSISVLIFATPLNKSPVLSFAAVSSPFLEIYPLNFAAASEVEPATA